MDRYQRFNDLLIEMKELHDSKGADYEGKGRPYENIRASEQWGVEPWKMAMMRVSEKMRRIQSYANGTTLNNESVFDSLKDCSILCMIAYVLLEEEKGAHHETLAHHGNGSGRISLR